MSIIFTKMYILILVNTTILHEGEQKAASSRYQVTDLLQYSFNTILCTNKGKI